VEIAAGAGFMAVDEVEDASFVGEVAVGARGQDLGFPALLVFVRRFGFGFQASDFFVQEVGFEAFEVEGLVAGFGHYFDEGPVLEGLGVELVDQGLG
jgi:hypothetical protein